MFKALIGSLAVIGIGLFAFSPSSVYAETVNCDSAGKDLQKALDNTPPGSDVFVTGDCDTGPFFIRKDRIRLLGFGDGGATLSGPDGGNRLLGVDGDNVELRGLNLDADGFSHGIIMDGTKLIITDVEVENASITGIRIGLTSHAKIQNSSVSSGTNIGIGVFESSSAQIFNSTIDQNTGSGIHVGNASYVSLGGNTIDHNLRGVFVSTLSSVRAVDNLIELNTLEGVLVGDQYGFIALGNPSNTIQHNGTYDVRCKARAIVNADIPQLPAGSTRIEPDCTVKGTIF